MTQNPRQVSDLAVGVDVTGYFMPTVEPHDPVLIGMPGTDDLFVCVFASREMLAATMRAFEIPYEGVAVVEDGFALADEMAKKNAIGERPYRIRLAVDMRAVDGGGARFVEVQLPREAPVRDINLSEDMNDG